MCKLHRRADFQKQLQSLTSRQLLREGKSGHRCADDVIHDEIGQTIVGCACIEKPGDIWMIKLGQDLAFRSETAQDLSGVAASIQYLDGDWFLKLTISARRKENCTHPASATIRDDDRPTHHH